MVTTTTLTGMGRSFAESDCGRKHHRQQKQETEAHAFIIKVWRAHCQHPHAPARFWLWPNLLSLDAPVVAVLWQILFARCFQVPVDALAALLLLLTVWLIYAADRTLDAWRGDVPLAAA